ncbi:MAG: secretin N-terminal domain-containing protein [Candidatus Omnitrophota bacterium]
MKKRILIAFVALLVFVFPSPVRSQSLPVEGGGKTSRISIDLKDANIKDVLKIFSQQAGLNFVASEQIQDKTLTLYLDHVTVQDALSNILSANQLEYVQVPGSDIFMVRPTEAGEATDLIMKVYRLKYARISNSPLEIAALSVTYRAALESADIRMSEEEGDTGTGTGGFSRGGTGAGFGTGGMGGGGAKERGIDIVLKDLLSPRGTLITDPRTNSIIITDIPSQFRFIEEAIAKLDRPVSQVMIEAEILETSVNAYDYLGVKWGSTRGQFFQANGAKRSTRFPFKDLAEGNSDATLTVGTLNFGDTSAVLELLKSSGDTKVLSRPRIMTMDNEGAVINIIAETAMASLTTATTVEGTALSTVGQAERKKTGISLRVTPQINDDQYVTMTLEPSVVRAEASEFFPTQFVDPQQRSAQTTVMVRDGETVVIGGLVSTDREDVKRKVPVLGDIPIVGLLFRHTDKNRLDRELLVFVTPHIVRFSDIPFVEAKAIAAPTPVTVTVPEEEEREQLPPHSKEKEIETVLNQFSTKPRD